MKKILILAVVAFLSAVTSHATPADDLAAAAQKLVDASNYSWTSTADTLHRPFTTTTSVNGATERDGFSVTKKTMSNNNGGQDYVEDTIYWGTQIAYLRNGTWKTSEELQAANGGRSGMTIIGTGIANSGRGIGAMTVATPPASQSDAGRPAQTVLSMLSQAKGVTTSGEAFVAELSYDYIAHASRSVGRNGPLVVSADATGSAMFWIKDGVIAKYQIQIKAPYENYDGLTIERTTTVEIKNVGTTVVTVPAEARAKFKL